MIELQDINNLKVDINEINNALITNKNISLFVLRLDKIDEKVSGNKIFKLYYFLKKAINLKLKIITFGGSHSNHLAATASACKTLCIDCIGIVRGEEAKNLSPTLLFCKDQGMRLKFISRINYNTKNQDEFKWNLQKEFGEHILIPEGGYSIEGVNGAALITGLFDDTFTHVCCPVGTATTMAGLVKSAKVNQKLIGFSALKSLSDFESRMIFLLKNSLQKNYTLNTDYAFGGFAKKNENLISFMNTFYSDFAIPTDFVYTGKMMYGVFDLIKKNYFKAGDKVLCIHTGGLQGNLSLPAGALNF